MIQRSLRSFNTKWRTLAASLALAGFLLFAVISSPQAAAAATYSCGTYSSGAYSSGSTACTASGSGVGAPNTGFAKLMEPANLAAILGSLVLLIAGIIIVLKSRSRKKQNVSFTSRD